MSGKVAQALEQALQDCERRLTLANRRATDRQYMIEALVPMLGPKAREVWRQWQAQGLQRVHFDWQDDIMALSGEEVAERHLQINEACKTAEPVDMAELDAHLPPQRKVVDIVAEIQRLRKEGE